MWFGNQLACHNGNGWQRTRCGQSPLPNFDRQILTQFVQAAMQAGCPAKAGCDPPSRCCGVTGEFVGQDRAQGGGKPRVRGAGIELWPTRIEVLLLRARLARAAQGTRPIPFGPRRRTAEVPFLCHCPEPTGVLWPNPRFRVPAGGRGRPGPGRSCP